jgi:hypothetical protein
MFTHLNRSIYLTGTLSPPIMVNSSDALKTKTYNVQMEQDIEHVMFLQGGPAKSIADFKGKKVSGNIELLPRINQSNNLENSVIDLLNSGQNYNSWVSLTTLLLPYNPNITAQGGVFNGLSTSFVFDICLVKSLTIKAKEDEDVLITIEILGQADNPTSSMSLPSDENSIYRTLNWYDCNFSRNGSALENVKEFELKIEKTVDQKFFLFPLNQVGSNYDRPFSTGVNAIEVKFKIIETVTSLFDAFTFSLGGYSFGVNLTGTFGPIGFAITDALFKASHQELPDGLIERTTEGFAQMNPLLPTFTNFLISP